MKITLSSVDDTPQERKDLILRLDKAFQDVHLVGRKYLWENRYFPIKSLEHYILNQPVPAGDITQIMVFYDSEDMCLYISGSNIQSCYIQLCTEEFVKDYVYLYGGRLTPDQIKKYIIPIRITK